MGARVRVWVGVVCLLTAGVASADVLSMGGTRNPATGQWTGLASLETVAVGNPGNAADTTGYGSVGYDYRIGTYEVTAGQYTEFLNKVGVTDTYGLYNTYMDTSVSSYGCNIKRTGASGSYSYSVAPDWANRPVNYVSYWDSCRFANWLHNGQPAGVQGNTTTEDGAYTLTAQGMTDNTINRNGNWKWAVTSENEWYKAAYYDPNKAGGAGYWLYPTRSNTAPGRDMNDPSGNNANYYGNPYPIQSPYYTTVVGQFQNSASGYGTFDQGGNVWEWNEAILYGSYPSLRGGSFSGYYDGLQSSTRISDFDPMTDEYEIIGFRVSQVPEPGTIMMVALASVGIMRRKRA